MNLSVLIVTKNCRDLVRETLRSVRGIADEILISDEGSTDGTVELAKTYEAMVYDDRDLNLGRRKGRLLGKARYPWVLILDSDERVSSELKKEILKLKKSKTLPYHGYRLPYQNHVFSSPVFYGGEAYGKVRLFQKKFGKISKNQVHEEIFVQGKIGSCSGKILHHSYRNPLQLFAKFTKYAWVAAQIIRDKERKTGSPIRSGMTMNRLFLYGPHMFWARFIKDEGYRDGLPGFILALAFGYMESLQYWIYGFFFIWKDLLVLLCLGVLHLFMLYATPFINWPEMLMYPWLVLHQGMKMFTEAVISYPPGGILALGALFEIFGYSLTSYKLIAYLFLLLIDIIVYVIARKITGKRSIGAIAVLLFAVCTVFFQGNTLWFETIMTPLYLVSFYSMVRYFSTKNSKYLYYAVVLSSLSFLTKQTGILSIGAIAGMIVLDMTGFNPVKRVSRLCLISLSVFLFLPLFTQVYFILTQRGGEFIYWVIGMVFQFGKSESQYALFPTRADVLYSSPLIFMFFFTLVVCLLCLKARRWSMPLLLFSIVSIVGAFPRFGFHRLVPAFAFLSLGTAIGVSEYRKKYGSVILLSLSLLLGVFIVLTPKYLHRTVTLPQFFTPREYELARFIDEKTKGEPFTIIGDYDYLYFLLNRRPTVLPWVQLFPAPASTPGLQAKLINSLETQKVPYVFVIPYHPDKVFFDSRRPEELLGYIEKTYTKDTDLPLKGTLYVRR